jgi:hypothetical protein
MSELSKKDCISLEEAMKELGVVRNTFNVYLVALGIPKHKFPLDRRLFITKEDFSRLKRFLEENKSPRS